VTPKRRLRQVGFVFERNRIRGLEQNPETKSRWAKLARSGKKVMQFLGDGRYVANGVDGTVTSTAGELGQMVERIIGATDDGTPGYFSIIHPLD
jgi:hypothetical protein